MSDESQVVINDEIWLCSDVVNGYSWYCYTNIKSPIGCCSMQSDILTKSFGSSKKKKAVESRQRNQVKGEALEMALEMAVDHAMSQPDAKNLLSEWGFFE